MTMPADSPRAQYRADRVTMDAMTTPTPRAIRAGALQQRLLSGEPLLLVDVREPAELEMAALQEPVLHLPLSRSAEWLERIESLIGRDQTVVVLCHAGIRSWQFACWLMEAQGYDDVLNLQGGIDAWSVEVDPSVPRY
ncbi:MULTISPECIES: rhodanese-like domain-containing protein [unclassified Synechococcus]|uniref:rhodanese-like domain-containing protein n=1 Tax=unclassified Synechococcus TaxID=2626047 RepID=UPI0020CD50AA|nr:MULTISPECIES: rhodanese-like domain-containing protein [unclassified Synechococcus]CAK6698174.1 Thiosulfate sulfurtransferase GlpE [Synechococcus sp. CBW1107]